MDGTTTITTGAILIAIYLLHGILEYQHYKQCKSNIFRVLMYQKSDMCIQLEKMLSIMESVCSKNVFHMLDFAATSISALSSM